MTKANASPGRPTNLPVDGELIRKLRSEMGWTQVELGRRVYEALGKRERDDVSAARLCRRWENLHSASPAVLTALAGVLGTTEAHLREGGIPGPAPDRVGEITDQLREQLSRGNKATCEFMEGLRHLEALGGIPPLVDAEAALHEAARAVEVRLGGAQLTRRGDELDAMGAITGWNRTELLRPAGAFGYWLIATEGMVEAEPPTITRDRSEPVNSVVREAKAWLERRSGDSRAILEEDKPWFRLRLEDPRLDELSATISFVRVEPSDTGLSWRQAGVRERLEITKDLANELERHFNFVRNFDDESAWPDFTRMRLELRKFSDGPDDSQPACIGRCMGGLDGLIDRLPSYVQDGEAHAAVTRGLASDLDAELLPHLEAWPRACWRAEAATGAVHIFLDVPWNTARLLGRQPVCRRAFGLYLVEVAEDGTSRTLPWSQASAASALERVRTAIAG